MTRLSQLDCASAVPHHLTSRRLFLVGFDFASVPQATYLQNVFKTSFLRRFVVKLSLTGPCYLFTSLILRAVHSYPR